MQPRQTTFSWLTPIQRIRIWYALLLLLCAVSIVRLFYLQVIRHDYYQKAALKGQLKQYEVPAERGIIEAHSGNTTVPIVLNESKYTLFADPKFVKDPKSAADAVARIIGGSADNYEKQIRTPDTRYVVLAKKLNKDQQSRLDGLKLKGIGTREVPYRTYPQNTLAAQLLGFVNDDGEGKYGIEQALNNELKGTPGELKAITDAQGVPLAANKDNIVTEPQPGDKLLLTIDIGIQEQLEDILKSGLDKAVSKSGSAVIIDARSGAIKAMANYPTYNPAEFYKVDDASKFTNDAVSAPLEVGSTMKPLTAAAALDLKVVDKNTTYYDPSRFQIDDAVVSNIEEDGGPGTRSIADILQLSLNTGATWLLMQMGGGHINQLARQRWHDYMVNHYEFGKLTGIEQGYEAEGSIPDPNKGYGLNIQYANTAFGQGMTATPLQMAAAFAAMLNGGTYYRPHLVDKKTSGDGNETTVKPEVVRSQVVSADVSQSIKEFMEYTISKNYLTYGMTKPRPEFSIGGKTGTAQIAKPSGGYYDDRYNGMFMGFVGGNDPQYVIAIRVNEPKIHGYAGSKAAAPIFGAVANMLIDNSSVMPRQ
jgi:cell division protein FtsI (penicillin-binding protein 3)